MKSALMGQMQRTLEKGTRRQRAAAALPAGLLAVLLAAGLIGASCVSRQSFNGDRSTTLIAAVPSPSPSAKPVLPCRLPAVIDDETAVAETSGSATQGVRRDLAQFTAGFISLPDGQFIADPSAVGGRMGFDHTYPNARWQPVTYDWTIGRWLPVSPTLISPDHTAYAYVTNLSPSGNGALTATDLHVYDLRTGMDRLVVHTDYFFSADYWGPDGIYATASLPPLNLPAYRRLNPSSGAIEDIAAAEMKPFPPLMLHPSGEVGSGAVGRIGRPDAEGRQLLVEGGRGNRSATITYYLSDGSATVFNGPWDPNGFDPDGVLFDGTRLWAVNYNGISAWTWTASEGLLRFAVHNPPAHSIYVTMRVAGTCG